MESIKEVVKYRTINLQNISKKFNSLKEAYNESKIDQDVCVIHYIDDDNNEHKWIKYSREENIFIPDFDEKAKKYVISKNPNEIFWFDRPASYLLIELRSVRQQLSDLAIKMKSGNGLEHEFTKLNNKKNLLQSGYIPH